MKDEFVSVPHLGGRVMQILSKTLSREDYKSLELHAKNISFSLKDRNECAMGALALLLLSNIMRLSGGIFDQKSIDGCLGRLLGKLNRDEVMQLEIEGYSLLRWIGEGLGLKEEMMVGDQEVDGVVSDVRSDFMCMLEEGIKKRRDLVMWYYTGGRGEYGSRRISPLRIEAEKFLTAYCHLRREERVFRLSRIARLVWAEDEHVFCDKKEVKGVEDEKSHKEDSVGSMASSVRGVEGVKADGDFEVYEGDSVFETQKSGKSSQRRRQSKVHSVQEFCQGETKETKDEKRKEGRQLGLF